MNLNHSTTLIIIYLLWFTENGGTKLSRNKTTNSDSDIHVYKVQKYQPQ